jgi:hypothetical protein
MCGLVVPRILARCTKMGFPATAATISAAGFGGIAAGVLAVMFPKCD